VAQAFKKRFQERSHLLDLFKKRSHPIDLVQIYLSREVATIVTPNDYIYW